MTSFAIINFTMISSIGMPEKLEVINQSVTVDEMPAFDAHNCLSNVAVIVPTLNAAKHWRDFHDALQRQPLSPGQIWIIDSSSTDGTPELARSCGYHLLSVKRSDFNHGSTRQWAAEKVDGCEILVYLTQDAVLCDSDSISNLVRVFHDPSVGAATGRQLPHKSATILEAHARTFNYPTESVLRTLEYRKKVGFKAVFASNSFSAYRASALKLVGGFPNAIVSEEMLVFARMLLAGLKTAYVADAKVYHSHSYSPTEEFRRYFDLGVLHAREPWLLEEFGHVRGEGMRFVLSELRALWPRHSYLIPLALLRTLLKFLGYHAGLQERRLSRRVARFFSQQRSYWA